MNMQEKNSDFRGPKTGQLPRLIASDVLWAGGSLEVLYGGEPAHGHLSLFVIKGSEKTLMIDTGHPLDAGHVKADVEAFLDGAGLDYIFPTHAEFPHAGLLRNWMELYPEAVTVCGVPDYPLYFPDMADRFRHVAEGDHLDLGDRNFVFLPAIWRDVNTLWGFDTKERILFASDGFAYLHPHRPNQHDWFTSEQEPLDPMMVRFFNERAMSWTRYVDAANSFQDIDRLLNFLKPRLIAPAHGNVIDTLQDMLPTVKSAMAKTPESEKSA